MSKARDKGTAGENYFLEFLRVIWPTAERAPLKGVQDKGDFVGVPLLVEAKHTKTILIPEWVRKARTKAEGRWVLVWKGDTRTRDGKPLMVMDADFGFELLDLWERHRG